MGFFASVNGVIVPAERAQVSVLDNGFAFGDSVYEVLRTYEGRPFEPGRHFRRLRASAARLGFDVPGSGPERPGGGAAPPRPSPPASWLASPARSSSSWRRASGCPSIRRRSISRISSPPTK